MGVDIDNLDKVFELHLEFFKSSTFTSIALAQNGDYIGGIENAFKEMYELFFLLNR